MDSDLGIIVAHLISDFSFSTVSPHWGFESKHREGILPEAEIECLLLEMLKLWLPTHPHFRGRLPFTSASCMSGALSISPLVFIAIPWGRPSLLLFHSWENWGSEEVFDFFSFSHSLIKYCVCVCVCMCVCVCACVCVYSVIQSCPILCDPMDCSPPGSSIHGISQARILEWVAISFSRGSSSPHLLRLLALQVNSLPLSHQGSPKHRLQQ